MVHARSRVRSMTRLTLRETRFANPSPTRRTEARKSIRLRFFLARKIASLRRPFVDFFQSDRIQVSFAIFFIELYLPMFKLIRPRMPTKKDDNFV